MALMTRWKWILSSIFVIGVGTAWFFAQQSIQDIEDECPPIGKFQNGIHYVKIGQGPPVVFLHGAGANLNDYLLTFLIESLRDQFSLYFIDRPGSGHSKIQNWNEASFNDHQVKEIIRFLEIQKIERPILVGHSLGAAIASALASRLGEKSAGLMLIAGAVYPIGTGSSWYTHIAALPGLGWVFNHLLLPHVGPLILPLILQKNFSPNPVPEDYEHESCLALLFEPSRFKYNAHALNDIVPFMARQLPNYAKIKGPISMIYGAEDKVIATYVHSREFRKIHPRARLHMLDNVGHLPHHSHNRLVASEIQRLAREQ